MNRDRTVSVVCYMHGLSTPRTPQAEEMDRKLSEAARQMAYEQAMDVGAVPPPTNGVEIIGLSATLPPPNAARSGLDVAKVRGEAESWLRTYPRAGADALPSDEWAWLNGRCHPRIVLALCDRNREMEGRP